MRYMGPKSALLNFSLNLFPIFFLKLYLMIGIDNFFKKLLSWIFKGNSYNVQNGGNGSFWDLNQHLKFSLNLLVFSEIYMMTGIKNWPKVTVSIVKENSIFVQSRGLCFP